LPKGGDYLPAYRQAGFAKERGLPSFLKEGKRD